MAATNSAEQSPQLSQTFGQRAKKAGLFILFGTILIIPRVRRLRRRVWVWGCVRLASAACGCWLLWRYAHVRAAAATLIVGVLLLAFGLLIRAEPVSKSVDALAHELGALIVLNGGTFRRSPGSMPIPHAQIFVHPERLTIQGPGEHRLLEIPVAKLQAVNAHPVATGSGNGPMHWEVEINWQADPPRTTTFRYDGPFAEHLAQVTESTLRSQWKKELLVLP
jgi:hypothetical protein